jgi:hypothetical protein
MRGICGLLLALAVTFVPQGALLAFSKDEAAERARTQATEMYQALQQGDLDTFSDHTHPRLVALMGGKRELVRATKKFLDTLQVEGFAIRSATVREVQQVVRPRRGWVQAILPTDLVMAGAGKEFRQTSYLLGLSQDDGRTWKFVDTGKLGEEQIRKILPECSPELTIPARGAPQTTVASGSLTPEKPDRSTDAKATRAAFDKYLDALKRKAGLAAADAVTAETLEYYEKVRISALQSPARDVRTMATADQILILLVRAKVEPKDVQRWNGRQLFAEAIKRGWTEASSFQGASLGTVVVQNDRAVAKLKLNGADLPLEWHFERQDGVWKNDLMPLLRLLQSTLTQQLEGSSADGTQVVHEAVEEVAGRKLPSSIWDPPGVKTKATR